MSFSDDEDIDDLNKQFKTANSGIGKAESSKTLSGTEVTQQLNQKINESAAIPKPECTVVFALPGNTYSREFLLSWSNLLFECIKRNVRPILSQNYSSVVHFARAKCFGGDVLAGPDQKPFQGKLEYDYIMCIDSDIIFDAEQFFELLKSPYDVTSGLYMMHDNKHFPVVKEWNKEYFKKHGTFEFLTAEDIQKAEKINGKYINCVYNGLGFFLIKKNVVEKIKYPWFSSDSLMKIGDLTDMCSEDVSFAQNLQKAGVDIMVDTSIRVGHLKCYVV